MHFNYICTALMGMASVVASAPAEQALKWKSRENKRSPLAVTQQVAEQNIVVIEQNLDKVDQLAQIAEQQFALRVQAEVALVQQLETIKNNIRVNHFKARFAQVNTVIVTVATVVDARDNSPNRGGNRYMVNQLVADNGFPDKEIVVMVSEAATMTINSQPTAKTQASVLVAPTATPTVKAYDPNAPFGQLNQSIILPAGVAAPTVDLVFADPATIILPNQNNLFVESAQTFVQDCGLFQQNANAFLNLGTLSFTSFQQISADGATVTIVKQTQTIGGGVAAAVPANLIFAPASNNNPPAQSSVGGPPPSNATGAAAAAAPSPSIEAAPPAN